MIFQVVPRSPVRQGGREAAGEGKIRFVSRPGVTIEAGRLRSVGQIRRQSYARHDSLHGEFFLVFFFYFSAVLFHAQITLQMFSSLILLSL